jgi:hypothetical protein
MPNESERVKWLTEEAQVTAPDKDGTRYVEVFGLPIGMFSQDPDSGRWQYRWLSRDGFRRGHAELNPPQQEHAEYWAVTMIAREIDWNEQERPAL